MAKVNLTDRNWIAFKIEEIFEVINSKPYHKKELRDSFHGIPYITRTSLNNGLEDIIEDNFALKNPSNTITLGAENADFFFQGNEYITGNKMYLIKNENINKQIGLFLVQIFRSSIKTCGFGYGQGLTGTRFKKRMIMLPIDSQNNPDWQFMEDYIKQKEKEKIKQLIDYYTQQATDILIQTASITDREWKAFPFNEIFEEIQRGKRLTKSNQIEGDIPYISSSATQNGVDNFISNEKNVRKFENCLTIANSGSVGATFFHHYQFIASDHVTELKLERPNKYVYLFLASIIKKLEEKYSFNREINDKRIQREKILLPINDNAEPDWQFMEDFIRQLEKNKIETILKYYNTMINNEKSARGG
ncbi:restriction endonuclease [Avibacterium paragallinarum]|uniref:restriction endonuclease subunit S n=1 Tax=Avibacterium paragallinarum TaxID=728 RepID=UPI0010AAA4EB|nr:restriction endonuclease [Avibacterium paragallinarum]